MTPKFMAEFMCSLSRAGINKQVLDPCCGEGVFLEALRSIGYRNIDAIEIDNSITPRNQEVSIQSFISTEVDKRYDLIIGNPPYIRWKNLEQELKKELLQSKIWNEHCNYLCDYSSAFIIKAVQSLNEKGELIFITPSYWLNKTSGAGLRSFLAKNGYFEVIYNFGELPIFKGVTIATIVFKYIKSKEKTRPPMRHISVSSYLDMPSLRQTTLFEDNKESKNSFKIEAFSVDKPWIIAPHYDKKMLGYYENICHDNSLGDFCNVSNGLVSGLDKAFQMDALAIEKFTAREKKSLIKVIKAKNLRPYLYQEYTPYCFIPDDKIDSSEELKHYYPNIWDKLIDFQIQLNKRYFFSKKKKYWEWSFLRNFNEFQRDCHKIFVPCKDRITKRNYFRFALAPPNTYATQDVTAITRKEATEESVYYILALLNSKYIFNWLKYRGITKGDIVEFSSTPVQSIPYRKIDFNNFVDREYHNKITEAIREYIANEDLSYLVKATEYFEELIEGR